MYFGWYLIIFCRVGMNQITTFGLGRIAAVLMLVVLFLVLIGVVAFTKTILLVLFILIAIALLL